MAGEIHSKCIRRFILNCSLLLNVVLLILMTLKNEVQFTNDVQVGTQTYHLASAVQESEMTTVAPPRHEQHQSDRGVITGAKSLTNPSHVDDQLLPSCRSLFLQASQHNNRTIDNFLTDSPVTWVRRSDDSRVLHNNNCRLHKYTASQARQCLAHQHVYFTGDSLTRYQYLSLAHFLHTGAYPPRFGVGRQRRKQQTTCSHFDTATQQTTCAVRPNIVMEGDFLRNEWGADAWEWYHAVVGGWTDGSTWDGQMECNCARSTRKQCNGGKAAPGDCLVENLLYYYYATGNNNNKNSSESQGADDEESTPNDTTIITLSFTQETGWDYVPRPLQGFHFTHCGRTGSCRRTWNDTAEALHRAYVERSYDWNQSLTDALRTGLIQKELPPIDIALYNRGLWNKLPVPAAQELMPLLRNVSRVGCFYKTTTGSQRTPPRWKHEREQLRPVVQESGCGWYDVGWLTAEFSQLNQSEAEYDNVFWDAVHYQPWVYEELNNVLLNVLCNTKPIDTAGSARG